MGYALIGVIIHSFIHTTLGYWEFELLVPNLTSIQVVCTFTYCSFFVCPQRLYRVHKSLVHESLTITGASKDRQAYILMKVAALPAELKKNL
jgi:hypothetical protein